MKELNPRDFTILIIEDDVLNIKLIMKILQSVGYKVEFVTSGDKALELIKIFSPDLILLDLQMPKMDGLEVCHKLKNNSSYDDIPIIFLTANHDKTNLLKAFELGAADYLTKPFHQKELLARIETHLKIREQAKQIKESEAKLSSIVNNIYDGILVVDDDGKIRFANPSAARIFEKPLSFLLKQPFSLPIRKKKLSELKFKDKYLEISVNKIEWENEILNIVCLRDSTKRKKIQENLKISLTHQEQLTSELKKFAETDTLTGVFNRRYLLDFFKQEIAFAKRYNSILSILIIDIDFFKNINDNYGHDVGDEILKQVSNLFSSNLREIDCFARYGGEEFVAILPQANSQEAWQVAERIRVIIANSNFNISQQDINITISIGISQYQNNDDESFEKILKRADQALYQAKSQGRNRTIVG